MTYQEKPQRPGQTATGDETKADTNGAAYNPNGDQGQATARDCELWMREGRYLERAPSWECVDIGIARTALGHMNIHTWRLAVPGGWIYKVTERYELGHFIQLCFVPEPQQ